MSKKPERRILSSPPVIESRYSEDSSSKPSFFFMLSSSSGRESSESDDSIPAATKRRMVTKMLSESSGRAIESDSEDSSEHVATKMLHKTSGHGKRTKPTARICDNCESKITPKTTYYHCTKCDDYDLCEKCEKQNDKLIDNGEAPFHDSKHPTVKYRASE